MRFIGIDIASENHVLAIVDEDGNVLVRPKTFKESSEGHELLLELAGEPEDVLVAMEATGHYWRNVFARLASAGFQIALLNPLRTRRFAEEDMLRAKTDEIDALSIARFAAQKKPRVTPVDDELTEEMRELVLLRDRMKQDFDDRTRQLHRALDLSFPEFTKHVRKPSSRKATALLARWPTARAFAKASESEVAELVYDGRHRVGKELARALRRDAKRSVGAHQGTPYALQTKYFCEDLDVLRERLATLDRDLEQLLERHEVGKLLTTIQGIGPNTAARLVAVLGDPSHFDSPKALAAYVGVSPKTNWSGKRRPIRSPLGHLGHADLRSKLWMPTLSAVKHNPWLRAFYERLKAKGKKPKVALVAAERKLLGAIYSVAKNRRPFEPILTTCEVAPTTA